jgi:hypothetical protein
MIISFAWTTEAVKAHRKKCTRRDWSETHFQQWVKAYREDRLVHDAYDRSPRVGGLRFGQIKLVCEPYWEALRDMPVEDLELEGGYWNSKAEFIELFGGNPDKEVVVMRFYLLRLTTPVTGQLVLPGLPATLTPRPGR